MSKKPAAIALALVLLITLVIPAALFVAPQKVSAQSSGATGCVGGLIGGLFGITSFLGVPVGDKGVGLTSGSTAGSTAGSCIYELIIKPLARQLIHQILQAITASIINWINGNNGTGQPSFVRDLAQHLQAVGDSIALPFISQIRRVLNPAYAAAIASSLLTRYALGTSVGGFLTANRGTLALYSQNPGAFIAGNWSQGGISAWNALTTEPNNNPYLSDIAAQAQLGSLISQGQVNRRQDLAQSGGLLSFCGATNSTTNNPDPAALDAQFNANAQAQADAIANLPADATQAQINAAAAAATPTAAAGINPGASCYNSDGTAGKIQTPGTFIKAQAEQALGSDMASLINPSDIDSSLAAIFGAALQKTMNSIFGTGGLFAASQPTSFRPQAITNALQTTSATNSAAINSANSAANTALTNLKAFTDAWTAVGNAATTAQSSLNSLKVTCTSQASAADSALGVVNGVFAQAQSAINSVSGTQALALQVQQDAQDTTAAGAAKLAADMQTLAAAPPSAADITAAQANAASTGTASASTAGALSVSGGSLVDQMTLISQNAVAMLTNPVSCPVITP